MTAYIETLVGQAPDPTSVSFRPWVNDAAQALLQLCPLARTTTYYFAQAGNDTTGDGSEGTPWKTIAKAQTTHDGWTQADGGLRLRFKRGDTWRETTGLAITKDHITVDAYGDGALPLWSWFDSDILETADAWANAAGDRWTATEGDTGWLREKNRPLIGYAKVGSTAEVEAIANSFYWVGGTLHINAGASVDPNDIDFEYTDGTNTGEEIGISIAAGATGCRVDNLALHGWGMDGGLDQDYGVKFLGTGTDVFACTNCEVFYNDRHNLGQNASSVGSGGVSLWANNVFGMVAEQNGTPFIAYAGYGGQECIALANRCQFGSLPDDNRTDASGRGFFSHSDGAANHEVEYVAFVDNVVDGDSQWPCNNACDVAAAATPAVTNVADARVIRCGTVQRGAGAGVGNSAVFRDSQVVVGCHYEWRPAHVGQLALGLYDAGGWIVNTFIDFDMAACTGVRWGLFNTNTASDPKFWHCWIHVRRNETTQFVIDVDNFTGSAGAQTALAGSEFVNSILSSTETNSAFEVSVGLLNTAAAQRNNAFYNVDATGDNAGSGNAVNTVQIGRPLSHGLLRNISSLLIGNGEAELVETDFYGRVRSTTAPTIGPFEADALSGVGRVINLQRGRAAIEDMQHLDNTLREVNFEIKDGKATRV